MQEWLKISLLLCGFGFLKEIRPSEMYVTDYLLGPWRDITPEQLSRYVYPVATYSYAAQLILVFLITDFLRYKPIIILLGISGIITFSLLLWTTSIIALQILQFFYGTFSATEVAYYTYIYAKVDKKFYPKVTSHARAAALSGKLIASITSQLLIYFELMNYRDLTYITLAAQICATFWAFLLPSVKTSLYFHRKVDNENLFEAQIPENAIIKAFKLLRQHFINAYSNRQVLQWSIWYSAALCGFLQVISYAQVLWTHINGDKKIIWNGAVDAIASLFCAGLAILAGYIHAGKFGPRKSLFALSILSILGGISLLVGTWTDKLFVSYLGYILFLIFYSFTITVASAEIARYLEEDSYGLIFGINTFVGLIMQTILTIVVVSESGFALDIISQFYVYSSYFAVLGIIYLIGWLIEFIWDHSNNV